MFPIIISDASGKIIETLPAGKAMRSSSAMAAADQKRLNAFAAEHPEAASAEIGPYSFTIKGGRSRVVMD